LIDQDTSIAPPAHLRDFDKINDLSDVKIGVFREFFNDANKEVVEVCNKMLEEYKKVIHLPSFNQINGQLGAKVVEIQIPELEECRVAHILSISKAYDTFISLNFMQVLKLQAP
jgi:hypothetical protein